MPEPLEVSLTIRVTDEEKPEPKPKPTAPKGGADAGVPDGKGKSTSTHGLPPCVLLTEDGRTIGKKETQRWPEGFDGNDGGVTEDLGEGRGDREVYPWDAYPHDGLRTGYPRYGSGCGWRRGER